MLVMRYAIRTLVFLSLFLSHGCAYFRPSFISEESWEVAGRADNEEIEGVDGPTGGHFNSDGEWIPDNPSISLTYKIPDISSGIIFDVKTLEITPSIQVELLEINTNNIYIGNIVIDIGVGFQRAFVYIGKLWTNIFEISTGFFAGWNFDDKIISFGFGITILRF